MDETNSITATNNEKFISAIGYLGVLCIVPLLLEKQSTFAQHHGRQGLVLMLGWLVLWVGNFVPILGQIVWMFGSLILFILLILGMINAFQGRMWEMPILGKYAKQIKL